MEQNSPAHTKQTTKMKPRQTKTRYSHGIQIKHFCRNRGILITFSSGKLIPGAYRTNHRLSGVLGIRQHRGHCWNNNRANVWKLMHKHSRFLFLLQSYRQQVAKKKRDLISCENESSWLWNGVVALICGWGPEDEVKYLCIIKLLKLKNHKET